MRVFKWGAIPLALAIYAAERGLDVSGYENLTVAYVLWSLAGLLALIGVLAWVWTWAKGRPVSARQPTQSAVAHDSSQAVNISAGGNVEIGDIGTSRPNAIRLPKNTDVRKIREQLALSASMAKES